MHSDLPKLLHFVFVLICSEEALVLFEYLRMNPYGQFFGVPQQYYGAIPPNYQSFLSTGLVGYAPVAAPPPSVPVSQPTTTQPSATEASVTQVVVTQEKTPVTTVFVGNIPERAPDSLVKSLLMVSFFCIFIK